VDQRQLAEQLLAQAKTQGVELVGPNGLLNQLTKNVLETALEAEMTEHLGYDKHDPTGRTGGNSRNGTRSKTVLTEIGPVQIGVPRDTDSSFDPAIVRKRQRRLSGVDEIVLSLSAKGLTTGEIAAHFDDVYGATVSKDTISRITDKVVGLSAFGLGMAMAVGGVGGLIGSLVATGWVRPSAPFESSSPPAQASSSSLSLSRCPGSEPRGSTTQLHRGNDHDSEPRRFLMWSMPWSRGCSSALWSTGRSWPS
jgi:hypothetical protein